MVPCLGKPGPRKDGKGAKAGEYQRPSSSYFTVEERRGLQVCGHVVGFGGVIQGRGRWLTHDMSYQDQSRYPADLSCYGQGDG